MSIKQCFQFLDTLGFSLKHKVMFPIREANQITRAVIVFNSIEMMNNPAFRQWFAMSFFPDNDMLPNKSVSVGSDMFRFSYKNIPTFSYLNSPSGFMSTIWATRSTLMNQLITINTWMLVAFLPRPIYFQRRLCHICIIPLFLIYINLNKCIRLRLPHYKKINTAWRD